MRPHPRNAMLVAVLLLIAAAPAGALYTVDWYTIDCGGTSYSAADDYELAGTIGQPDAGFMSGGGYELSGGFWFAAAAPPVACGCGDLNQNGQVELNDFITFQTCFGLAAPTPECPPDAFLCADLNGINGVELNDFIAFSTAFGLPAQGSPPNCE